jgi:hypothetical protein
MTKKLNTPKLVAHLVASPTGLSELSDAVETALASIEGRASVELVTPDGEQFTLHIIRRITDDTTP